MKAADVTATLEDALAASGCDAATVVHKPRLLSDNGSSYISHDLADWLDDRDMDHVRGAPNHPQTQGKIERWHQTLKNPDPARELLPARRPRTGHRSVDLRPDFPPLFRRIRRLISGLMRPRFPVRSSLRIR